ncbi:MAG: heterodisulfide reductase-related iron-sulfur binding cluster [Pseudomonadota bacterium]
MHAQATKTGQEGQREVSYYPGCSLESTARDYAESVAGAAELLGVRLNEVPDWNCCGATAGHSLDHKKTLNLAARNLALAAGRPQPVVVPCALCFNRLKSAQAELAQDAAPVIPEIAALGGDYAAAQVVELNTFFSDDWAIAQARRLKKRELTGLRPVCYYGCQGQRPPAVTGHQAAENPQGLDRLLTALGADVRDWPYKTDCCGASHSVPRPDIVFTLVGRLYERALAAGANCVVTGCQMCQANLDLYQEEIARQMGRQVYLPVLYFTELIGLALGHPQAGRWLDRHMISPRPLLASAGLDL